MLTKYFLLWFPMIVIAILNGALRQGIYVTFLDNLSAHQLSVVSGIIFFALYIWIITGKWRIKSSKESVQIGLMWLLMTIIFEFLFGHFVMGHTWEKLLYDYNILEGRLWIVVLIWVTISPFIFYRIHLKKIN
jgi:hypothetical protein